MLGSDQTHSCTQKAAMIAGVKFRAIPAERGTWSLRGAHVRQEIENVKKEGFIPFFLTVTLGTTPTCAVDDLEGIAEVGKDHPEIWLHVDAAVISLNWTNVNVVRWLGFDLSRVSPPYQVRCRIRFVQYEYAQMASYEL